ncbi:MAG: hypothetical protein L6R37_008234 [Teloschistes peruensis]|nr:MAG: hypothetical protein L6R37_008234 [Teloschistes peruensis]
MKYLKSLFFPTAGLVFVFSPHTYAQVTGNPVLLTPEDSVTLGAMNQILSLFSLALDTKMFEALVDVYAPDAVIDAGNNNTLTGLPAITDFYNRTFSNASLQTQHTSTTVIGYNFTSTTAASTSYADALYFGPPVLERLPGFFFPNQSLIIREKFINQYKKGSDGAFKISRQTGPIVLSIEGDLGLLPRSL